MKLEYDEVSPITGNLCVIVESDEQTNITSYMCMETGFTTTDKMQMGSELVTRYESQLTELMRASKFEDKERGLMWYPAFLQMPGIGMLYPSGKTRDDIKWEVCKVVMLVGKIERIILFLEGKTNITHLGSM